MREVTAGDRVDQYQLTDVLARSGMASIFKATDTLSGETVALKVPHPQYESDVVFFERFRREEQIGQRVDHPAIARVLKPRDKSRMYMAMEYVDGRSLRAIMGESGPLPAERALAIAREVTDALAYLHARGIVHRDIKPENILVTPSGGIKMLDFGIALDESARRLTWAGLSNAIGTPDYMAPEQIGGRRGDARTDVYAVGTLLYEMLTGHLPFSSENPHALLRAKANEDPKAAQRVCAHHRSPNRGDHFEGDRKTAARPVRQRGGASGGPSRSLGRGRSRSRGHPGSAPSPVRWCHAACVSRCSWAGVLAVLTLMIWWSARR